MSQGFGSEAHVDRGAVKESQAVARSAFPSNEHYIYDLSVSFHNNRRSSRQMVFLSRYTPSLGSGHVTCSQVPVIVSYHFSSKDMCKVDGKFQSFAHCTAPLFFWIVLCCSQQIWHLFRRVAVTRSDGM